MKQLFIISNKSKTYSAQCVRDQGDIKILILKNHRKGFAPSCVKTTFVDVSGLPSESIMPCLRLQAHIILEDIA